MRTHSPVRQDQLHYTVSFSGLQSDLLVVRPSCHIVDVWMELYSVNVGEVTREDS